MEAADSPESWYLSTTLDGKIPENSPSSLPIWWHKIDRKFGSEFSIPGSPTHSCGHSNTGIVGSNYNLGTVKYVLNIIGVCVFVCVFLSVCVCVTDKLIGSRVRCIARVCTYRDEEKDQRIYPMRSTYGNSNTSWPMLTKFTRGKVISEQAKAKISHVEQGSPIVFGRHGTGGTL